MPNQQSSTVTGQGNAPAIPAQGEVNRGMAFACILIRDGLPLNPYEAAFVAERFNATVLAVNNHAALVAALQAAVSSLEWTVAAFPDIPQNSNFRETLAEAKAALKQAGGAL